MFEHSGKANQILLYAGGATALPRMAFARPSTLRFHERAGVVKRVEDMILTPVLLVLLAVPLVLFALLIRLESPGPVLFRQRRVGLDGTSFVMWKFRTMQCHREPNGTLRQARRDDPRVTRVGAWLRRLSLDELPQLLNVLRGEMSLVGPRPHAPGTRASGQPFEQISLRYAARHRMRPGITGVAQVRGWRGETETEDKLLRRVDSDLEYIETWSVWLDLKILLRTATVVLRMRNAY
jgi:polysaccharide biosynthesis protein PslA